MTKDEAQRSIRTFYEVVKEDSPPRSRGHRSGNSRARRAKPEEWGVLRRAPQRQWL